MLTKYNSVPRTFVYKGVNVSTYWHVEYDNTEDGEFVKTQWQRYIVHDERRHKTGTVTRYASQRVVRTNGLVKTYTSARKQYHARHYEEWECLSYDSIRKALDAIVETWDWPQNPR